MPLEGKLHFSAMLSLHGVKQLYTLELLDSCEIKHLAPCQAVR